MWSHLPHSRGLQTITDPSITISLPVKPISAAHHCLEGGREEGKEVGKCVCMCVCVQCMNVLVLSCEDSQHLSPS